MELNSEETGRMVRLLRHRLLNIASGIKSANSLLASSLDERLTAREREIFPLVHQECDQMCSIAERFEMLFGEIPKSLPIPLKDAVSSSLADLAKKCPMAEISVEMATAHSDRYICMATLNTLLREGVGNAYELSRRPLTILVGDATEACSICIVDQGEALSEEVLKMAFEPFYSTRTRHLGVGLAICKRLVENKGGSVSIGVCPDGNYVKFILPFINI